jgi:hypothetical protein
MIMFNLLQIIEKAIVKHRRKSLSRAIFSNYNGVVQYGAFKGMRLNPMANVSQASHGLKIFGLYESPIINQLVEWCPVETFVDIGAGDGYYPVGMLRANLIKRAICFEATEAGRNAIKQNAELNGVAEKIQIFGKADEGFLDIIKGLSLKSDQTLILCDIEGGEFDLIKRSLIEYLSGARFIIELHEALITSDKESLRETLLSAFPENYQKRIIMDCAREWNGIPELEAMHDLDRALVTSEGRKIIGEWLVAEIS